MKKWLSLFAGLVAVGLSTPATAFCGFYVAQANAQLFNNASKVVLARKDQQAVVTMSSDYEGSPSSFAMVVPVPTVTFNDAARFKPIYRAADRDFANFEIARQKYPAPSVGGAKWNRRAAPEMERLPGLLGGNPGGDVGVSGQAGFGVFSIVPAISKPSPRT